MSDNQNIECLIDFTVHNPYTIVTEAFWEVPKLHNHRTWIIDQYTQRNRLYHGLYHIAQMLWVNKQLATSYQAKAKNIHIIPAILYHDLIYDAKDSYNELNSARLWRKHSECIMLDYDRDVVEAMILQTAYHLHNNDQHLNASVKWLLDLDLISLALPWDDFKLNNSLIRLEFSHLTDDQFKRAEFLKQLISKPKIYRHKAFEIFESKARENVMRLINEYDLELSK